MIAVRENRRELEAALTGCPEQEIPIWEDDLCALTIELAKKFHGTATEEHLRAALEDAANLASMGLLLATAKEERSAALWTQKLREMGLLGLTQIVSKKIKSCEEKTSGKFFEDFGPVKPNETLRAALHACQQKQKAEAGIAIIKLILNKRKRELEEHRMATHLSTTHPGKGLYMEFVETDASIMVSDFLVSCIAHTIKIPKGKIPSPAAMMETDNRRISLTKPEKEKAQKRFEKFTQSLPQAWQEILLHIQGADGKVRTWLEVHTQLEGATKK